MPIAMTRDFVTTLYGAASSVAKGRTLKESMAATRQGDGPEVFQLRDLRTLPPFSVSRAFDGPSA